MDATELRTFAIKNSLFRCIQCGKCAASCPMGFKTILNPRKLVYETLVAGELDPQAHQELWDCKTCFTCSRLLYSRVSVCAARSAGTPGEVGTPSVSAPEPAFTSNESEWPW